MIVTSQVVQIDRHEWDDGLAALTFVAPVDDAMRDKRELAFVLHGLGSRKERHLDLCLRLARAGYLACAVDARLHGERQTEESSQLWGDRTSMPFATAFGKTVHGTVADLRKIADELGAEKYGVIGHSMGGLIATIVGASDSRAVVVVNVGGSIDMRIPESLKTVLPAEMLAGVMALDPVARAGDFWPTAVLLIHGVEDETVPVAGARVLREALAVHYAEDSNRLKLIEMVGIGHEFTTEQADKSIEFVRNYL